MFWESPFKDDHAKFSIPDYTTNDLEARMYTIERFLQHLCLFWDIGCLQIRTILYGIFSYYFCTGLNNDGFHLRMVVEETLPDGTHRFNLNNGSCGRNIVGIGTIYHLSVTFHVWIGRIYVGMLYRRSVLFQTAKVLSQTVYVLTNVNFFDYRRQCSVRVEGFDLETIDAERYHQLPLSFFNFSKCESFFCIMIDISFVFKQIHIQ